MAENNLEQMFQKNLEDYMGFQKNLADSAMRMAEQFSPEKNAAEMAGFEEKITNGIRCLMDMKPEDVRSDAMAKDEVLRIGKLRLYHYKPTVEASKVSRVPTMITYALVNRQYMMDIQPDRSVIKSFLDGGLDVYVIDWGYPTGEDMYLTIDDHVNWYMNDCVDYIRRAAGVDKINLLGICQGGTFSTMYTALHPEKIKNLVTMVVPIDFATNDTLLFRWGKYMNIDSLVDAYGVVPGEVMNFAYLILKPISLTLDKYVGMAEQMDNPEYMQNFMRMEKWVFDSPGQAGETLRQFIKDLYRDNKLVKGEMELGGKKIDLKNITQPLLCACAEYDHLVPLSSSRPLLDAVGSVDKTFISFKTGHIGMYVSSQSQKAIAPNIVSWIRTHS
jgi:polyhydroxyalkanoate synthase